LTCVLALDPKPEPEHTIKKVHSCTTALSVYVIKYGRHVLADLHDLTRRSLVRLSLKVHGRLCVGNGAVLLVPVEVLDHGRDAVGVHEDITTKK
jgi:hypothetical protein